MSNSKLISCINISPHKDSPRNKLIDRITIHCVVGQLTAERIGEVFQSKSRMASCNYGVGKDGRIVLVVDENDRSFCSSSSYNDNRAVTIEVASDTTSPYAVTDSALASTINLCEDICRRNNKTKLLWFDNKQKALNYIPKHDEMLLTVHRWFANKACPGEYLYNRHGMIAQEVTRRLSGQEEENMDEEKFYSMFMQSMERWRNTLRNNECSDWSKDAREYCIKQGIFSGSGTTPDGNPNYMWQDLLTREQAAAIMFKMAQIAGLVQ